MNATDHAGAKARVQGRLAEWVALLGCAVSLRPGDTLALRCVRCTADVATRVVTDRDDPEHVAQLLLQDATLHVCELGAP